MLGQLLLEVIEGALELGKDERLGVRLIVADLLQFRQQSLELALEYCLAIFAYGRLVLILDLR